MWFYKQEPMGPGTRYEYWLNEVMGGPHAIAEYVELGTRIWMVYGGRP